jgi:hypothetical protein
MDVSSAAPAFPLNQHHRRLLTKTHSPMIVNASPIAVNNKIRAIQTRKPRITLQSYYDYTDIRPLNIGNTSGTLNSPRNIPNLSPERLVERSKELRLGRVSARPNPRASVLSTTSITNQQSALWTNVNSPMGFAKQPQANSSTTVIPPLNKLSTNNVPDIQVRLTRVPTATRQPLIEQQNSPTPVEPRHKSLPKTKTSIPKAHHRTVPKSKSPFPISHAQPLQISHNDYSKHSNYNNNNNIIRLCESEDDETVPIMDEEFEDYLKKAVVKCADWLMKYVFDQKHDENNE